MTRLVNDEGIELIKTYEGLELEAYQDQSGSWTIGYGHTFDVGPGERITEAQADALLRGDLLWARCAVDGGTNGKATDNQFAAMVSLCYNIGATGFRNSTVLRQHNQGNYGIAGMAFQLWDKVQIDGRLVTSSGLLARRDAETKLYITDDSA